MTIQVPVRLTEEDVSRLDAAVATGRYRSRSDALRRGLELVLREEREREIEESYRRGYGKYPQEEWIGEVGLALFAARALAEEAGKDPL
jgi:Arc/MetJ-type ribon-helix-helix transcriptional regulator